MNNFKALVVSNTKITPKVLNWDLDVVLHTEKALAILQYNSYSIIAVSESVMVADKLKIQAIAKLFSPNVTIVEFTNETNLGQNIKQAFRSKKKASLQHRVLDNAFDMELACKLHLN